MVRRTGIGFSKRADEGTVFDAGSIGRMAAGQERVWMQLRVEPNQSLGLDKLVRQRVPFLIAAIAQDDAVGLAHNGHLADPLLKRDVGAIEGQFFKFVGVHVGIHSFRSADRTVRSLMRNSNGSENWNA